MSWHEEFLSTNQKKKSISSIGDLFGLIEEVYEVKKGTLFKGSKSEIQLLREQFVNERKEVSMTLQAIPEIAVSELGWTNLTGEGDTAISGPERRKLEQFLSKIQGDSFQTKINSLSKFYDDPDAAMQEMFPEGSSSMPKQIAAALGYLTFFKTLTKVISNFNAASAGFNFEAFLAVLVSGYQVKANTGTIADFVSRADGTNTPISLKLYQEGKLHVGGSFTDLANDLAEQKEAFDHPFMRYLAVTKEFEGGQKEGLDINGTLRWYQFDFTLENVFDILARSSSKSQKCIQLPVSFMSGETQDFAATLPGSVVPSPEQLENVFLKAFKKEVAAYNETQVANGNEMGQVDEDLFGMITAAINWSTEDTYFTFYSPDKEYLEKLAKKGEEPPEDFEPTPAYVSRGDSRMMGQDARGADGRPGKTALDNVVLGALTQAQASGHPAVQNLDAKALKVKAKNLAIHARNANNGGKKTVAGEDSVLSVYSKSKLKDERMRMLKSGNAPSELFASIEESLRWYNDESRTDEERKAALKQSYGYLTTEQFNLNQSAVARVNDLTNKRTLPEGQTEPKFAELQIGMQNTQNMLNRMTGLINDAIFGIFLSVKNVQDNTYSYMAGGMQDETMADAAIDASNDIIERTTDLKQAGQEQNK